MKMLSLTSPRHSLRVNERKRLLTTVEDSISGFPATRKRGQSVRFCPASSAGKMSAQRSYGVISNTTLT
jgi:hypothetical protein